jgi:hypothetical protein
LRSPDRPAPARNANTAASIHDVQRHLDEVDVATDIERVTVLAQLSIEAGLEGLTTEIAEQWYRELGIPRPGNWRSTFNNAKQRGYLHSTTGGWRPTAAGENFAVHGIRRAAVKRRARRAIENES